MTAMAIPPWLIGVLITVAGSTSTALGLVLQKYSHQQNALSKNPVLYYKQFWWLLGVSIFMSSQVLNMVAMALTPQIVLSCLGAWSLMLSAVFGHCILGEHLKGSEKILMFGAVLGVASVMAGTPSEGVPVNGDLPHIASAFTAPGFFVMLSTLLAFIGCLFGVACFTLPGLKPVAWSILAAILAGFTVAFFKSVSLLMATGRFASPAPWTQAGFYVIVLMSCFCGICQMHSLNLGLQHGEALVVVPIYYALGMLAQILTGAVVFNELSSFTTPVQLLLFWGGTVLLVLCIFGMTYSRISSEVELEIPGKPDEQTNLLADQRSESGKARSLSQEWKAHRLRSLSVESGEEGLNRSISSESVVWSLLSPIAPNKPRALSSLDSDAFPESFGESGRTYAVSLTGPPGIS
eukprot:TRINITY_DN40270_c0_g1_i1.p1 TRINITY_DN40270_c0_g1~~TRINITY_DN40270_c0_g1_i1.p1  ORF type:complete len:407 (+),score=57.40 TRINITY_DN40270_c0_g1_i1:60-1280(+)